MNRPGSRGAGAPADAKSDLAAFEESYRVVQSNLMVALADIEQPRVMVTSANANEGKTITCANLALCFARAGRRVILVDLDLRHPNAHRLVGAHNEFGVSDLLLGRRTLEDCLQYLQLPGTDTQSSRGVYFIGTGPTVNNPAELLGLNRTAQMLDGLGRQADLVLVDTPPVLPVADTLVIGRMVSGAVLVVEARKTTVPAVANAKDRLARNRTRLLGVVLNKFKPSDVGYGESYRPGAPAAGSLYDGSGPTSNGHTRPVNL